ncbi:MAG TPA: diguanylate cyclase [Holophaga sp.]|nr:diguanylate cyclase [Holophaga sp.]
MSGFRPSLGYRVTSRIALIFLLFGALQFFLAREMARRQFQAIEESNLLDRTRQAFMLLDHEASFLKSLAARTAQWGDTYAYVQSPNQAFIDRAFGGDWSRVNNIDFVAVVASDGRNVWSSEGYPTFPTPPPTIFQADRFERGDRAVFHPADGSRPIAWFIGLTGESGKVWVYCAHTITTYNGMKAPRGMLILGRLLRADRLSSAMFGREDALSLVPVSGIPAPSALDHHSIGGQFSVYGANRTSTRMERSVLVSYSPLQDSRGNPMAALRLAIPRMDERVGARLIWVMSGSLFLIVVISLGVVVRVVRRTVIAPIEWLASFFTEEGEGQEDILITIAKRGDEIGILAERADALFLRMKEQAAALERQANTDRLTGLANRHFFETHFRKEVRRILRLRRVDGRNSQIAVVMLDVDHFKLYNDTNGHMAGDGCLRAIADAIQSCIFRPGDMACRFGGEEFILVLPDTDEAGAMVVAEAARASVEWMALPHPASPVSSVVTVSAGVAGAVVTEAFQAEALIELADKALYAAKAAGRNRVLGGSSLG